MARRRQESISPEASGNKRVKAEVRDGTRVKATRVTHPRTPSMNEMATVTAEEKVITELSDIDRSKAPGAPHLQGRKAQIESHAIP